MGLAMWYKLSLSDRADAMIPNIGRPTPVIKNPKVLIKESIPSIISGTTLSIIYFLSATTLAGAVGAGGIGAVALNYGYQSFNNSILYTCVFILLIMVQIIQMIGNWLYKKFV